MKELNEFIVNLIGVVIHVHQKANTKDAGQNFKSQNTYVNVLQLTSDLRLCQRTLVIGNHPRQVWNHEFEDQNKSETLREDIIQPDDVFAVKNLLIEIKLVIIQSIDLNLKKLPKLACEL